MKPTSEALICPYTGLRSFTEEESLYFKGRDEQIDQVAKLLERNKFVMLTGASGEGKSSLIYAGLIPNSRAGFFKAKYTNWIVTDFRPERTPVKNMASAVAETFAIPTSTAETELKRGFSSLIDLYVNSEFYTNENDDDWKSLSDVDKKNKTRAAANLLIIVDQFEEFFTNPENYLREAPSQESQIVVNLALETARIALQRNLPVYVVCTMRSDYIGQCSAFRGLPEYIGFSQFFVPRLKRQEIKQVIEEPALLSGNRISRRLVERLVYDLSDGIDQLPILQHALRQIWLAADQGIEEMDLIHYAMVGGMSLDELPEADHPRFISWFSKVPENQKKFYSAPGLSKVIEIHASRLYESAWIYYNENHASPITQRDAKRIIALTFSCLTKIDDSRAVRNRMTLLEITRIINQPHLTVVEVGGVIDLFRESNNSFIRPYKMDGTDGEQLSPETILDITHESLIRNWELLNKWAAQEFDYYTTFLDFKKQLLRWKNSDKSNDFLLPLGPLTFFEEWYKKSRPNAWWIDRYSEIRNDHVQSLQESEIVLSDTKEFIKRSAGKVRLTRAFIKYGARRIAIAVALVAMVLLTGFYWYDARRKTNQSIEKSVIAKSHVLLKSKEVGNVNKAVYLLIEERLKKGSLISYLKGLPNKKEQIGLTLASYRILIYSDKFTKLPIKSELIDLLVEELKAYQSSSNRNDATFSLEIQNQFLCLLVFDEYYNPSSRVADEVIPMITESQHQLARYFFTNPASYKLIVPTELNLGMQLWLSFGKPKADDIIALLKMMSPFGDSTAQNIFNTYYVKGSFESNGRVGSDFNGGYHMAASLYSAAGDSKSIIRCFEQLPESYFRTTLFNNYTNLLGFLYQYNHKDEAKVILQWMVRKYPTDDPLTVYRNAVIRSGYMPGLFSVNLEKLSLRSNSGYFHVNLALGKREQFFSMAAEYEKLAKEVTDPDERNYLLAMHYKRVAILYHKNLTDRNLPVDQKQLDELLSKAWNHFNQVGDDHLSETISITYPYYLDGVRTRQYSRRMVFLYPDYRDGWFARKFNTDLFFDYAVRNELLVKVYNTPETINLIHDWLSAGFEVSPDKRFGKEQPGMLDHTYVLKDQTITDILTFVNQSPAGNSFDKNLPLLIMANRSFDRGDVKEGMNYFNQVDKGTLKTSENRYEYLNSIYFANLVIDLVGHLAENGEQKVAMDIISTYTNAEKAIYFTAAADALYKSYQPAAFVFLDSAYRTVNKLDFNTEFLDSRPWLIYRMGRVGGEKVNKLASNLIRDTFEQLKAESIAYLILGTAADGNYFTALQAMPSTLTEDQELTCYYSILLQVARNRSDQTGWAGMDDLFFWNLNYFAPDI